MGFEILVEPRQEVEGGDDAEVGEEVVELWVPGIEGCRREGGGFRRRGPTSRRSCFLRLASAASPTALHPSSTSRRPSLPTDSCRGGPSAESGGGGGRSARATYTTLLRSAFMGRGSRRGLDSAEEGGVLPFPRCWGMEQERLCLLHCRGAPRRHRRGGGGRDKVEGCKKERGMGGRGSVGKRRRD